MNPKSFPKRLDSKTSCLRITVPENLDLALEGLIRKVLKEQPKTDDIYAFAANYFETLLKIRDKAGAKFTVAQLCPFHNEEEAQEMILLAGTFSKRALDGSSYKEDASCFPKTKNLGRKKKTDKAELESFKKSRGASFTNGKQDRKKKQATPDLIKKLPISGGHKSEREDAERAEADKGPERKEMNAGSVEEDFLPSDPIKELVEKEFSAISSGASEADKKGPSPSEGGSTGYVRLRRGDIGGESKPTEEVIQTRATLPPARKASEINDPRVQAASEEATADTGNAVSAKDKEEGSKEDKIDVETSKAPVELEEAAKVVKDLEDLTINGAVLEPNSEIMLKGTKPKEEKENKEEPDRLQTDEKLQKNVESRVTKETAPKAVAAPHPDEWAGAEESMSPGAVVPEMLGGDKSQIDLGINMEGWREEQRETSPVISSPRVRELEVVELRRAHSEDKIGTEDLPRHPPSPSAEEEKADLVLEGETEKTLSIAPDSVDARPSDKNEVFMEETGQEGQGQKTEEKKANDHAIEWSAQDEATNEDQAKHQENYSESALLPDGSKANRKFVENESSAKTLDEETLPKRGDEESEKEEESGGAKSEDPINFPPKEEEKLTSAVALQREENATEAIGWLGNVAATDSAGESREVKATHPSEKHGRVEDKTRAISGTEQLLEVKKKGEPEKNEEDGKADEGVNVKGQNSEKGRKEVSPDEQMKKGEEALTFNSSLQSVNEEHKTDVQENLRQETSRDGSNAFLVSESSLKSTNDAEGAEEESALRRDDPEANLAAEDEAPSRSEEELCSVVDVDVLQMPKEDALVGGSPEDLGLAESPPCGKSAFQPDDSPDNSVTQLTSSEILKQSRLDSESEMKVVEPNATGALNVPVKSEKDRGMAGFEGHPTPDTREFHTQLSSFREEPGSEPGESNSLAGGKHIVIIEDAEREQGSPEASMPASEIKIKTIQTHYYDALRVPEILTREYRVRGVPVNTGLVGADDLPLPSKMSPSNDDEVSPSAEVVESAERGTPHSSDNQKDPPADASPEGSGATSPVPEQVSKTSEASLKTTCGMFLSNERLFSSAQKEEIRYVSPGKGEVMGKLEALKLSERGVDGFVATATPATEETEPAQPSKNQSAPSTPRAAQENREGEEFPVDACEVSSDLIYGRTSEGDLSIASEATENGAERSPTNVRDEKPMGVKTEEESFKEKTGEKRDSLPGLEEPLQDTSTREQMVEVVGSSGETDSTASSAATEIKRSDSAGRSFTLAPRPSSSRSLDLSGRSRLLRTRSLSMHRHGVADFEVWSTIEKELEEAATKIQSKFRGYKTRKKLRRENAVQITTEESSRRTTPVEAEDGDDRRRSTGEFHDVVVLSDHFR